MKKLATFIFLAATLFTSCKKTAKQTDTNTTKTTVQEHVDDVLSTQWMKDIQLNNGSKWDANIETTQGVQKMQALLESENTSTINEYHELANKLNEVKNKVVKECTMKGASHDNLHIWLYPLIEKVTTLTKANTLTEASNLKQSIIENVNAYFTYFQ